MLPRRVTAPLRLGPYELIERLAQGGMAAVYKARLSGPSGFEKTVVVKAMLPALAAHEELVQLFSAEARLSAQLNHPNIVQVLDFGVADGIPYLVMEHLDGWTLSQLRDRMAGARKSRFPVGAAIKIARDVCLALGYAHDFTGRDGTRRQIIHRDVSPSNVMLCKDGSVKLLDFGIARVTAPSGREETRSFRGKYAYMAPEQVRRQPIDRRVDVFAAGTVLHEMLTGKRLFASVSELETLERVAKAQVTAPSGENPEVPRALDAIVKKALSRETTGRYSSGAAMAEALDTLEDAIFSRRSMAKLLRQIFPEAWTIVCEVCGKQVAPGKECAECGSVAPVEEGSVSQPDEDAQPLPPPPVLPPSRRASPPHLFVVPKLPSRREDDDSVKMGIHRVPRPMLVEVEDDEPPTERRPRSPLEELQAPTPPPPRAPVQPPMPASWPVRAHSEAHALTPPPLTLVDLAGPPPDVRGLGRGGRAALALLAVGVAGLGVMLLWPGAPIAPPAASPPAVVSTVRPVLIIDSPVLVARAAPKPPAPMTPLKLAPPALLAVNHSAHAIVKKPHPRPRVAVASTNTVRDGRIVDPFAGGD
jgi:serine/threonine protein kinase, bacterial